MTERTEPLAYGPKEAARTAGLSRGMIFKLIREGKLPARKSGARTLILAVDLKAYLDGLPLKQEAA
jgi:excisionase family DNA binding protein